MKNESLMYEQYIKILGLKAQTLISSYLDKKMLKEAKEIRIISNDLNALLYKEIHPTKYYIWHTQDDNKVRSSHAANNGKIFAWDNPPPTGNPGKDYNCRCWAEPYIKGKTEYVYQDLINLTNDTLHKWNTIDFAEHLYFGSGLTVTLSQCGHLVGIVDYYFYNIYRDGNNTYSRINDQIIEIARKKSDGNIYYDFKNSYPELGDYFWVFGGGVVEGFFKGTMKKENGMMYIEGNVYYTYSDEFTDIISIREKLRGTSDPKAAFLLERIITDGFGKYFPIKGYWETNFHAAIKID